MTPATTSDPGTRQARVDGTAPRGRHLLVADDDLDILLLLQLKLEREGYRVTTATDGPSALAAALADPPELVVVDWMMPGLTGLEVCQALRQAGSRALVVLLTAKAGPDDVDAATAAGIDDYITKPFSPRAVASRISTLFAGARP